MEERTKHCVTCRELKPVSEFHATGFTKLADGGKNRVYKGDCKVCANLKWKNRITDIFTRAEVEWKCIRCGYDTCQSAIEFHHKDPESKDFVLGSAWTRSEEKILDEIAKCVTLCSNCHRELHAGIWNLDEMVP